MFVFRQDFILQHYSEDGNAYEDEIADLMDLRQVRWTVPPARQDVVVVVVERAG